MMSCRSCHSVRLEMILDLGRQAWGNDFIPIKDRRISATYPLQLFYCHSCHMTQLGHTVDKETMFVEHAYLSGTTNSLKAHFVDVAENVLRRRPIGDQEYVLDIGGNDGTFLEHFKKNGLKVLNVDSGRLQATKSNEKGVPCLNQFFNEQAADQILKMHGPAAVIHGSGIFFHLEELHGVFKGIKKLLNQDNGLLVAEFIYLPDMIRNLAYDQIYHEHLLYYMIHSFQALLNQFGLEIYDAHLDPIHGGSCVAFITHTGLTKRTERLLELMSQEEQEGFLQIDVYKEFAGKVDRSRERLVELIRSLHAAGKKIYALGAPVKGSTMINYCHLTERDLECAVEINPYKCNTYIPGTKIPVYHQNDVQDPDVYLLLAWNFKDEILPKMAAYRNKGGKILVPIPEPELI